MFLQGFWRSRSCPSRVPHLGRCLLQAARDLAWVPAPSIALVSAQLDTLVPLKELLILLVVSNGLAVAVQKLTATVGLKLPAATFLGTELPPTRTTCRPSLRARGPPSLQEAARRAQWSETAKLLLVERASSASSRCHLPMIVATRAAHPTPLALLPDFNACDAGFRVSISGGGRLQSSLRPIGCQCET
jgi:hypothetical protein